MRPYGRRLVWIVNDPDGTPVELTFERWRHILRAHPELAPWRRSVLVAVRVPTETHPGGKPNERWHYLLGAGPSLWLKVVVAFEKERGFVVTAFARRAFP
jgi:hypothetical protein